MKKIRIQHVKTGKVSEITPMAWEQLKANKSSRNFEVINSVEKTPIVFNETESPVVEGNQTKPISASTKAIKKGSTK